MGKTKSEQKAQQSDSYFQIWWNSWWNSDSDRSSETSENRAKVAEHLGPGSSGGTDKTSKRGRKMKGFGLEGVCVILILVCLGVLAYLHFNKKSENQLAQTQMVDTISVERVQIPAEAERSRHRHQQEQEVAPTTPTKQEVKPVEEKVEAPVTAPVQEEVKVEEPKPAPTKPTNSKIQELEEWLTSHPEPQMPRGSTNRADWDKYSNDHYEWARKNSEYQGRLKGEIND